MQTPAATLLLVLTTLTGLCAAADYPERAQRTQSAGNHTWYIDPDQGNDGNPGTSPSTAWKSMSPANRLIMSRGDTLVIQPGEHAASLAPKTYDWRASREPPTSCWREKPFSSAWSTRKTFP